MLLTPSLHFPIFPVAFPYMTVEVEQETDGRWIAEIPSVRGALAYGATRTEAISHVEALVLRILADRLEHGEEASELEHVFSVAA